MESPIEFHSLKPDNEIASLARLRLCRITSPGRRFSTGRGFLIHELIIRDPLAYVNEKTLEIRNGVTYDEVMPKKKLSADALAYFAKMGRRGGLLGGKARAIKLSAEERQESARRAVQARWAKVRGEAGPKD